MCLSISLPWSKDQYYFRAVKRLANSLQCVCVVLAVLISGGAFMGTVRGASVPLGGLGARRAAHVPRHPALLGFPSVVVDLVGAVVGCRFLFADVAC